MLQPCIRTHLVITLWSALFLHPSTHRFASFPHDWHQLLDVTLCLPLAHSSHVASSSALISLLFFVFDHRVAVTFYFSCHSQDSLLPVMLFHFIFYSFGLFSAPLFSRFVNRHLCVFLRALILDGTWKAQSSFLSFFQYLPPVLFSFPCLPLCIFLSHIFICGVKYLIMGALAWHHCWLLEQWVFRSLSRKWRRQHAALWNIHLSLVV